MVTRSFTLPRQLAEAIDRVARDPEYRNNKSAVIERALIDFLNRRDDVRAA